MRTCWAAAVLLAVLGQAASAAEQGDIQLTPVQVAPHVYFVQGQPGVASRANQGFNSNAGFIVTNDGVVVFDALGTPVLGRKLVQAIRAVSTQPIRRVIISHFHADHFYGLQALKAAGAEVWAHEAGRAYLNSPAAQERLEERRRSLAPWVDESTRLIGADRWLDGDESFRLGEVTFHLRHLGPAHTREDLGLYIEPDGVLLAGDLMFAGRVPYVGEADSRSWLDGIAKIARSKPALLIGGHGPQSKDAASDLSLTRDYLIYLRQTMGAAVEAFQPFEEAYASTDWSRFAHLPAFEPANRANAYNTYLLMERESLQSPR